MILRILINTANLKINKQTARVVRVYNRNVPEGITENSFTQKGGMLAGSGAGTFAELSPGSAGQYLTPDSTEPLGLKWETPTLTIDDTTNHLINGGFNFAQRQTPGTLTTITDGAYGPDRWKVTRENADLQYIRVDGSSESGLTSPYFGQFKKITNAGKLLICQPLEYLDTLKFRGKTVNFQLQMKSSAAKTIKIVVVELQAGGTADTLPTLVSAWGADGTDPTLGANLATIGTPTTCSVTTSWQIFQFTGQFPTTSKNLLLMIWSNADVPINDTLSLAEVGLYFGASIRSWTPKAYASEEILCFRYFEKAQIGLDLVLSPRGLTGFSATACLASYQFKARKRIAPVMGSLTFTNASSGANYPGFDAVTFSGTATSASASALVVDGFTANAEL